MGFLDGLLSKFKGKTETTVDDHGEKIGSEIDKGADVADQKTGGKYSEPIDTGADKSKDTLDSLDGKDDDIANAKAAAESAPPQTP